MQGMKEMTLAEEIRRLRNSPQRTGAQRSIWKRRRRSHLWIFYGYSMEKSYTALSSHQPPREAGLVLSARSSVTRYRAYLKINPHASDVLLHLISLFPLQEVFTKHLKLSCIFSRLETRMKGKVNQKTGSYCYPEIEGFTRNEI